VDILRFYRDFSIDHLTEGHKHCRDGWVNTPCPFCEGNEGYHLGWEIEDEYYMCWRCGWHPPLLTLSKVANMPIFQLKELLPAYGINRSVVQRRAKGKKTFKLPSGIVPLTKPHKKYLRNRKFDPFMLEEVWGVKSTTPLSKLDVYDYRFRVLIPFMWNGQIVSFDTRDVTDKQKDKYKACPKERELIEHKKILYGNQEAWGSTGLCVEGPTDTWRLGERAFGTSGIKYTHEQVKVIATTFKRVPVIFDDEPQAQIQAKKLVADLKFRGVDSFNVKIKGDPGSLSQKEANELVKKLLK
jgi:hypothetical protein